MMQATQNGITVFFCDIDHQKCWDVVPTVSYAALQQTPILERSQMEMESQQVSDPISLNRLHIVHPD